MSKSRQQQAEPSAGVSISDMARMVGLSRQRFHQLVKSGVFPQPLRDEATRRPYYDESGQTRCLEVRRRNCGINGKVVLFYARRQPVAVPSPRPRVARQAPTERHDDVLNGVRALGLAQATTAQVNEAIKELYPNGASGVDPGEVIRAVFLRLRQNSGENVRR